jgi:hypothetical protein
MGKNRLLSGRLLLGVVLLHCSAHAENASETVNAEKAPRVFIADSAVLPRVRALVQQDAEGDTPFADAYARLCSDADAWLDTGPFSVMSKTGMPPSGDKHDYWSVGPYWWPDPESADGLPYIRRDGKVNPEYRQGVYDADAFLTCSRAVHELALAAYFSGKKAYGEHGLRLLRTWFLDAETKMNPNMRYAQAIPGRNDGRDVGVVEAESLRHLPDAIGMLTSTGHWTEQDEAAMQQWCRAFLDWMLHSGTLKHYLAKGGHNNIAIGLDSLVIALALYTRQPDVAREQITRLSMERIANQIEADGRMPQELARTKAFGYSIKALTSFFIVARLAEHLDIDLWKYTTENGRSLRLALDFLLPFVYTPKDFNYAGTVDPQQMGRTLLPLAIRAWNDDSHRKAYTHLGDEVRFYHERLMYPAFLLKR